MGAYIEFQNVGKVYKMGGMEVQALAGVDFTIDRGEFVVIAGASDVDKNAVLNILGGMDPSISGDIFVDGTKVSKFNTKQLATYRCHGVGFVFQFYNLVQNLTAKEDVGPVTQICRQSLDIGETIRTVGLKERASNFPAQLPGGKQQYVTAAHTLAKDPKFLLCDELTGALGYNTRKQILKLLQGTCRQRGASVIVITRNLALTAMGGKIIGVRNGKIDSIMISEHPLPVEGVRY